MNRKIAIASVLKPVDETRMYHKIGRSLSRAGYEVHIAGFKGHTDQVDDSIYLYPLFFFRRISTKRLSAPFRIFQWLFKIKPDILIITTHELLFWGILYKVLSGKKLIYDIQENYKFNIRYTNAFPVLLRNFIASYVRLKEKVFSTYVDHFFLAEQGYTKELDFIKNKYSILENKALINPPGEFTRIEEPKGINLLFSGTIAESTGIFECIEMVTALHNVNTNISLTIIGMCHIPETLNRLKEEIHKVDWIKLIGGNHPVRHQDILSNISTCDAAFIFYPNVKLVGNTIPTKLYEYLSLKVPILLQQIPNWVAIAKEYNAAIPIDPDNFNAEEVLDLLHNTSFYTRSPGKEVLWINEEAKLLDAIRQMLGEYR